MSASSFKQRLNSRPKVHRSLFLLSVMLLLIGIPYSRFLMSLGGFLLCANWFADGLFLQKFKQAFSNKGVLAFLAIFGLHLVASLWAKDRSLALEDLRIKLPLFFLPIIFYTSEPLTKKEGLTILKIYVLATLFSCLCGLSNYLWLHLSEKRDMALYISYVRFELNICLSAFFALHISKETKSKQRYGFFAIAAFFVLFAIYGEFLTAIALWFIVGSLYCFVVLCKNKKSKSVFAAGITLLLVVTAFFVYKITADYFNTDFDIKTADSHTPDGNLYYHDTSLKIIENGNPVYCYICEEEMETAWNKRSSICFSDLDGKGYPIGNTLIRYLNSKGLRKDRCGVECLSQEEIKDIENGIANHYYTNRFPLKHRFYEILWELDCYHRCGYAVGFSLSQRIELWKFSVKTIKERPLMGYGTGQSRMAIEKCLAASHSLLSGSKMKSHNQYLTFLVCFGTIGLLLIFFGLGYPLWQQKKRLSPLFFVFFTIVLLSMLAEDTLDQQDGITYFCFFYCYFLFLPQER